MKSGFKIDWKAEPVMREKILFVLIPFLLLIPFSKASWTPLNKAIGKANADLKIIETQVDTIKKMLEMTQKQMKTTTQIIEERSKVNDRVTRILNRQSTDKNKEVASIISDLSSRNLTFHLTLHDISIGPERSTPAYTVVPLIVTLEGGYGAIERYLSNIEKIEKPFQVRGVDLEGSKKTEGNTIIAKLSINIYLAGANKPMQMIANPNTKSKGG